MKSLLTSAAIVSIGLLGLLAPHASARATNKIVIGRSIAGVRLGDSLGQVHRKLGRPRHHKVFSGELGTTRVDYYRKLQVATRSGYVSAISTRRHSLHTKTGIGVGTSKRRLRHEFPNMDCYLSVCRVSRYSGSNQAGRAVTDFKVRHGRVRQITVGVEID